MTITKETARKCFGISSEAPAVKLECPNCRWKGSSRDCEIVAIYDDWGYVCPDCGEVL